MQLAPVHVDVAFTLLLVAVGLVDVTFTVLLLAFVIVAELVAVL